MKSLCLTLFLLFAVLDSTFAAIGASGWNYDNQSAWKDVNGSQCEGRRQSPVHIHSGNATVGAHLKQLAISGWGKVVGGKIVNLGTAIQFNPSPTNGDTASLTNHRGTYDFLQFHIHWGRNDMEGSEHKVDSAKYGAEIHFVHKKRGENNGTTGDYLSVLGVLCEADPEGRIDVSPWNKFKTPIATNGEESVDNIILQELLPNKFHYFHYEGSLTTPPCSEIVQWFVLIEPIKIPSAFLEKLRMVHDRQDQNLTYNYRDTQQVNSRPVFLMQSSAAFHVGFSASLLALLSLLGTLIQQ